MPSRIDNLIQRIQELQKFVSDRISEIPSFAVTNRELENLKIFLKESVLSIHIVSLDIVQAQALQKLLRYSDSLQKLYRIKSISFISQSTTIASSFPVLVFKSASASTRYELIGSEARVIGRNPAKAQFLLADNLSSVSGTHAELQSLADGSWKIQDLGSRNGTYINGSSQKLEGWYTLNAGDQICLGSPVAAQGSATLIFEPHIVETQDNSNHNGLLSLLDCNVLCLVVDPGIALPDDVKHLIEQAGKAHITKIFVIAAMAGSEIAESIQANLVSLGTWIKELPYNSIEILQLLLQAPAPTPGATVLSPQSQPELEQLCQTLEGLAQTKSEEMLLQRITAQLLIQVSNVEQVLNEREVHIKREIQQAEAKLQSSGQSEKEQVKKVQKRISDDKDKFFRQIKNDLSQSKAALLDEFSRKSAFHKIQVFMEQLQPVLVKQAGQQYLELRSPATVQTGSLHKAATQLCQNTIQQWVVDEWNRVKTVYADGGLDGLLQKIYSSLSPFPTIQRELFLQQSSDIDSERIFQDSIVEPNSKTRFKDVSLGEFIVRGIQKNLQTLSVVLGVMVTLGVIDRNQRQSFLQNLEGTISSTLSSLLGIPKEISATLPILMIIIPVLGYITYAWLRERWLKQEETAEKLKKDIEGYYRSLIKRYADSAIQSFSSALEAEERLMREKSDEISEQFTQYLFEVDKNLLLVKSSLEKLKLQQKSIDKERAEIQQFKRT